MIIAKYTETIVKNGCRKDGSCQKFFADGMIGVPYFKELYAVSEEIAYKLIDKWNEDPYREYEMIGSIEINDDYFDEGTVYYETEYYCKVR